MNPQAHYPQSIGFDQVLDSYEDAVRSGDAKLLAQLREQISRFAPLLASEFDHEVRRGYQNLFNRWHNGQLSPESFERGMRMAAQAGDPTPTPSRTLFEAAFGHLDFTSSRFPDITYASFLTERTWRLYQSMLKFRHVDTL